MDKSVKRIIMLIAILIIIAVILVIIINILSLKQNEFETKNTVNEDDNIIYEEEQSKVRDEVVGAKTETSRIKAYIGQYFSCLEEKDYQKAYDMLFDNFKNNYFTSLEQFQQYAENKYPNNIVLNYTDVDREGYMYVITVDVIDGLNISNSFSQRIVVKENSLNDFNVSFQMD